MAVFESVVEPTLIDPTFITEFPSELSPLAKANAENPLVADRFELYIARMEIANAYSEQNHPGVQYEHFAQQLEMKEAGDDEAHQMDEDYITALEYGMPPASGLGIGIDRLVMLYTQQLSIRDVILFPLMKPLPSENPSDKPDSSDTDVSGDSNNNAAADAKP
jgi:lysyl-tRNA synthetase class 2